MPDATSCRYPFPETLGFGSSNGDTTVVIPELMMASVQGAANP